MGRGIASQFEKPLNIPDGWRYIQWLVENAEDLAVFLEDFVVRMRRVPGNMMLIQAPGGTMNITLYPGDCLVVRPALDDSGEQLGVIRSRHAKHFAESETPELILPMH